MNRAFWSATLLFLFFATVWSSPDVGYGASTFWSILCGGLYGAGARWLAGIKPTTATLLALAVSIALPAITLAAMEVATGEPWFNGAFSIAQTSQESYFWPLFVIELLLPLAAVFLAAKLVRPRSPDTMHEA